MLWILKTCGSRRTALLATQHKPWWTVFTRDLRTQSSRKTAMLTGPKDRAIYIKHLDYFLWGYLKSRVYENKPKSLDDLKVNISDTIHKIQRNLCNRIIENWTSRVRALQSSIWMELYLMLNVIIWSYKLNINLFNISHTISFTRI